MVKHRINKTGKITVIFVIIITIFLSIEFPISAQGEDINFYVSAVIPDNQINKDATYFDLSVAPKQQQTLQVEVVNEEDKDLTVEVSAISASTNRNGIIDYLTPDIKDETLLYPFSEMASVRDKTVTIPANSTETVNIDITLPDKEYDGVVLGGIVIAKKPDSSDEEANDSITINNNYSYVIGVKLTETDTKITPNFELVKVEPELVDYRAAIVHYLRNTEPYIVKGLNLELTITNIDTNEQYLQTSQTIDMAPNSVFPLTAYPESESIAAGNYRSRIVATLGDDEWVFEKDFTIDKETAKDVNEEAPKSTGSDFPYIVIILILSIIIILLFLFLLLLRRRKKEEKKN